MRRGRCTSKARPESDEAGVRESSSRSGTAAQEEGDLDPPPALWLPSPRPPSPPPPTTRPALGCWAGGRRAVGELRSRGKAGPLRQGARFGASEYAPRSLELLEEARVAPQQWAHPSRGPGLVCSSLPVGGLRGGLRTPGVEGGLSVAAKPRGASAAKARQDLRGAAGPGLPLPGTRAPAFRRRPSRSAARRQ